MAECTPINYNPGLLPSIAELDAQGRDAWSKLYQLSTEINSIAKSHLTNRHVYRTAPYPEHQLLAYYTNYLAKEVQTLLPVAPDMPLQNVIPVQKVESKPIVQTPVEESSPYHKLVHRKRRNRKGNNYAVDQTRKCTWCDTNRTPEWRSGPNNITLCNACGLQWFKASKGQCQKEKIAITNLLN